MKDFKPVYKEVERPLIGFKGKCTCYGHINVRIINDYYSHDDFLIIGFGTDVSRALNNEDAQDFIDNLQKVVDNMKKIKNNE